MRHISLTPFGRQPVSAAHLAALSLAQTPAPAAEVPDKWAVLRDLTVARAAFGLTDRDLAVLAALLSFHPAPRLADDAALIVHPSNAALGARSHGMAEATLRRHLAALVRAGLILRHDSPNGKRYALRGADGAVEAAFGFDLRPLLLRAPEIAEAAAQARAAEAEAARLRLRLVLALRDIAKLMVWGDLADVVEPRLLPLRRALRRRLSVEALADLAAQAQALLEEVRRAVVIAETEEMSGNDPHIARQQQNSNEESHESEPCHEGQEGAGSPPCPADRTTPPPLPLALVLKAAPEIALYAPHGIRDWRHLVAAADQVRPMLGISPDAWAEAVRLMGPVVAAVVLSCILQDAARIRQPGGYLRALSRRAAEGGFSPGPMVMALLRREEARAA
ncbi:plasmid replication protein RepC [Tabrizicola sp. YIM 78059]|uniref:plasmid replication protein RepC n=1 Tax=Tabrizicola sp. YIM 78059 TaxID=2529861 RepID=UPI0020B1228A|nr:plasmid replication protein RepC [Tabrizicola sp. YIM 78059]